MVRGFFLGLERRRHRHRFRLLEGLTVSVGWLLVGGDRLMLLCGVEGCETGPAPRLTRTFEITLGVLLEGGSWALFSGMLHPGPLLEAGVRSVVAWVRRQRRRSDSEYHVVSRDVWRTRPRDPLLPCLPSSRTGSIFKDS